MDDIGRPLRLIINLHGVFVLVIKVKTATKRTVHYVFAASVKTDFC